MGRKHKYNQSDIKKMIGLYNSGLSTKNIAKTFHSSGATIWAYLHLAGVKFRPKGKMSTSTISTKEMIKLYNNNHSLTHIAELANTNQSTVRLRLIQAKTKLRNQSCAIKLAIQIGRKSIKKGVNHPCWKGGRYIKDGYVKISIGKGKYVAEHRMVWEKNRGKLLKNQVVHHLNGIKTDNRIENLFATTRPLHHTTKTLEIYEKQIRYLENELNKFTPNKRAI